MPSFNMLARLSLSLAFVTTHAWANPASEVPAVGWSGDVGVAIVSIPTYQGSPNRLAELMPAFDINYRTQDLGSMAFSGSKLAWRFLESEDYQLGVYVGVDGGRKSTKAQHSGFITLDGDDRLSGMGDILPSAEIGIRGGAGPFRAQIHTALGHRGNHRTLVDLGLAFPVQLSEKLSMSAGPTVTWGNTNYMQDHFGVSPAQAASSRFSAFTAKAGFSKLDLNLSAEYALTTRWKLAGAIGVRRLLSDASRSPLAERKISLLGLLGVGYGF